MENLSTGRAPEPHRDGVAAVASVSAGAHQPEGARRGGKEAAEVGCADRDEGASEAQAAEEDLARQVALHACPARLRGGRVLGGTHPKMLQDACARRWARSHPGGDRAPQKRSGRLRSGKAAFVAVRGLAALHPRGASRISSPVAARLWRSSFRCGLSRVVFCWNCDSGLARACALADDSQSRSRPSIRVGLIRTVTRRSSGARNG